MNTKVKNQHYVPQLYLRHFCDRMEKLFVFDKPQEKVFQAPTDQVASTKYFYDIDPSLLRDGVNPQFVEHALGKAETAYSSAIKTTLACLEEKHCLCDDVIPALAEFIGVQSMRTRETRVCLQQFNALLDRVLENSPEARAKYHMPDEGVPFVHAMLMFDGATQQIRDILLNHIWIGVENRSNRPLITSDSPVVKNPHIKDVLVGTNGLASPGIELFLPLSPKFGVMLLERTFHEEYVQRELQVMALNDENVQFYNCHQVIQSDRQLFSNDGDFRGVRELLQRRPDVKDPNRQRAEFIWGGQRIQLDEP